MSSTPANLTSVLLNTVRFFPNQEQVFVTKGRNKVTYESYTYSELYDSARKVLSGLRAHDLAPGDEVVLQLASIKDTFIGFWACVLGGFVPVPLAIPPSFAEVNGPVMKIRGACQIFDKKFILTNEKLLADVQALPDCLDFPADLDAADLESCLTRSPEDEETFYFADPDELAMLMLTSGSTGNSKAVQLSHRNVISCMEAKKEHFGLSVDTVTLNWIRMDHVAGIIEGHIMPLWLGAKQLQAPSAIITAEPFLFLQLISDNRATFTFAPNFLFGMINDLLKKHNTIKMRQWDLSSLDVLISGGEAIVVETAKTFLDTLSSHFQLPRHCIRPAFGMTETCAGCVYSTSFPDGDMDKEFASLGHTIGDVEMRVVDDEGVPLFDGEVGHLQLRGSVIHSGYLKNEVANEAAFTEDGWFTTGDRAFVYEGELTLSGRAKDSIIINGVNYYSHEIEAILESLPDGVLRSFTAACPTRLKGSDTEQLVIFFSPTFSLDDDSLTYKIVKMLSDTLIKQLGIKPHAIIPLPPHEIPKTSLGKIRRSIMSKRYERGRYHSQLKELNALMLKKASAYVPAGNAYERTLVKLWAKVLRIEESSIGICANFFETGGTSLNTIALKSEVDEHWEVDSPIIWIFQYPTIKEYAAKLPMLLDEGKLFSANDMYDPLVPLNLTGDKEPFFCVHPGVGDVLIFIELAKRFQDYRPFYGLRARGFNEGETYFSCMDEMVDAYVEGIRKKQPHGPYYVAGYSYGGAVAFCICKKLEAMGETVAFCGVFNLPPHIKQRLGEITYLSGLLNLSMFLDLYDKAGVALLNEQLKDLTKEEQLTYVVENAPAYRLKELDLDAQKLDDWVVLAQSLIDCGKNYDPEPSLSSISVFIAHPLHGTREAWKKQLSVWDDFTDQPNEYIDSPGEHYSMMSPIHVAEFSKILKVEIERRTALLSS
eukprot:CAMPEP_0174260214 /NCGR_PEP_ID=MMETSP0439-20130205/9249_1 /TAXON_ID=0 /ORGANISM="Stereomyxa ramosa, Strain Chinc5" /LENGTH=935 /DNA_ID=CAMNT_0015344413 /DNA_START=71 /DNA_END=2878 /DNA_ORIENTATION=+